MQAKLILQSFHLFEEILFQMNLENIGYQTGFNFIPLNDSNINYNQ